MIIVIRSAVLLSSAFVYRAQPADKQMALHHKNNEVMQQHTQPWTRVIMNIEVFNRGLSRTLEYILIFFMAMMVFSVVWQVFTRFILNDPSVFTDELSRYLLIWIGILGGAYTFSIKRHLALELLITRLNARNQHVLNIVINCLVFLFAAVALVYGGWIFMMSTLHHNQLSPGLAIAGNHLPIGYVYAVAPLSGVIICYCALIDIVKSIYDIVR